MRHARIQQAKPERSFAERIVAVIVAIAMLGGMGYATTSAAMAEDTNQTNQTLEQRAGITMGLYDYDRNTINNSHALHFMSRSGETGYNKYVGPGNGAYTGIVNTTLTDDGYPTMAADKRSESLDYLFGGKHDGAVTIYKPTGGLLAPDGDGYYDFNADSQNATYDKALNKFRLSSQNYCTNQTDTIPCFAPFGHGSDDDKYSFGMNLDADFYMPEGGQVNNQDMVFDFTGDDDVWVFIDGVLVLDLGGIHQALRGSIDFATGDINYYGKNPSNRDTPGDTPAGTITQAFENAGETWDSTPYKNHHLSFFYLERGDGGSNCKIRFNLPVKPSKAIDIEKETLGTIEANKQFQFQLFVNGSSTPYKGKYSVYNAYTNQVLSDAQTDNNDVITLTKGQFARVQSNDFTDNTTYTVRELNSSGYTVSANGSPMTQQGSDDNAYAETGSFTVGTTGHVTIVNSNVKPSNNKIIVKTGGDNGDEYTLHLTASGDSTSSTVTTATPADIVLVMDKSSSMKGDLDRNAKKAANELAGKLLTAENLKNQQVRMAVVTFNTRAVLNQDFTTNVSEINSAVEGDPKGGTNWEAALKQANDLLSRPSSRPNVKKHIIFLSDGDPTYRISDYPIGCGGWWTPCNPDDKKINRPKGVHGAGGSDSYGFNYDAALAEANKRGDAALYVVKTSTDAKKMANLAIEANAVNGKEFDGTNPENLTNAFDQIYSTITSSAKIKVFSITDTLSQWVDPVDFPNATNGDNITQYVTVKNGNTELTGGYVATYSVDSSNNRTVTVTFNGAEGIVAEKADNIDVSFKVKPSDAAYADYAENIKNNKYPENNNYPNTGAANTGDASAGQPGYYSNADAKLNYCVLTKVNGVESCVRTEAEYPHPVVRVKLGKINITKKWSDGADKHANDSVTVQLQRKAIDPADSPVENVGDLIPLNADNEWTATVNNLLPGYTYSVVETSGNDRYDVKYKVNNTANNSADLTKHMVWSSNAGEGTLNATIINELKTVSLSNAISVKKNLTGRKWKPSDQFSFTLEAKDNAPLPTRCKDSQSCTVTVNRDSADYTESFGDITYNAGGGTYMYYVTENSGDIAALHYSQAKYEVVVTVAKTKNDAGAWTASVTSVTKMLDDNGQKVSEPQDISKPVAAFTNHYIAVSALPLTGGTTDRQWLFVGGVVGGLAVLLIGAAGVWNGKKRLV